LEEEMRSPEEKAKHLDLKKEVLTQYGNGECQCVRCGFDDIRALSIDHIGGGGSRQRRENRSTGRFYQWLKGNNYPEGYQTLCMNCQFVKRFENKEHSHSRKDKIELETWRYNEKIEKFKKGLAKKPPVTTKYFEAVIEKLNPRFELGYIYHKLRLADKEKTLLRVYISQLVKKNKVRNIGRGQYEKILEGVN